MDKKSLKDVKRNNTAKVLEYILKQGPVSRIEIAEQSRFSPSTVSMAVSLLLKDGIVEEVREGVSTGGRKPILLQMKEDYGCIITVSVLRNGVNAEVFDLSGKRIAERTLISRYTSGNRLLKVIGGFVQEIQNGKTELPTRIIGLGLLCQDDLPEYDLMTEFSTSLSSDLIRLETALATRCGVPVKKELLNRYNLNYYLKTADASCTDYAYVNIGERITASFVLNRKMIHNSKDSIFDISSAVLSGSFAGYENNPGGPMAIAQDTALKSFSADKLAEKLTQVIKSALLFFPVKDVFIGGQVEGLEQVVEKISQNFAFQPVIRKAGEPGKQICDIFARQILWENCYALIEVN